MYNISVLKRKNSKKYTKVVELPEIEDVMFYMANNNLKVASVPYMFTYIELSDGSIITQEYNGILCSPTKLRDVFIESGLLNK